MSVALTVALSACAAQSRFTPNSAVDGRLPPIAHPAVQAYPGDLETIEAAKGRLIGWIRVKPALAARAATRYGATHVIMAPAGIVIGGVASPPKSFGLMRVPPGNWDYLPNALRPTVTMEPLPPNCECSHDAGYGNLDAVNWYVACGSSEPRIATAGEADVYCEPL
jgi:hypothetical protein